MSRSRSFSGPRAVSSPSGMIELDEGDVVSTSGAIDDRLTAGRVADDQAIPVGAERPLRGRGRRPARRCERCNPG